MSASKILMTGFLWLFLGLMSGCDKSEVMFETGEGAKSVGTDTSCEAVEITGGIEVQTVEEKSENLIYVYVCGQVRTPGVYSMVEASRLFQAVDMAGGILPEGDLTRINLAAPLEDGQKVYIPSREEAETMPETEKTPDKSEDTAYGISNGRVNINQASKEALMTLPGIGEAKADAILAYRQAEGAFENTEDLMQVPGIKEGVFSKIKDRISID